MSTSYFIESNFSIGKLVDDYFLNEEDAIHVENVLGLSKFKRYKPIPFVGLIEVSGKILFALPKFYSTIPEGKTHAAKLIIELMARLSSDGENEKRPADSYLFDQKKGVGNLSRVGIASFLLDDFYLNGLLSIKHIYFKASQSRSPHWDKTIQTIDPIHSQNGPLYDKWVSRYSERVDQKYITEIHRAVVGECSKLYGELIGYPADVTLGSYSSSILSNSALQILKTSMRKTFSLRETQVLKALIAWIEEGRSGGIKFFGTQYFHTVWELICTSLFSDVKSNKEWKDVMPFPEWRHWDNPEISYPQGKFQLDSLTKLPKNMGILIVDAKYYLVKCENGRVLAGPGIGDISKQLHYEELVYTSDSFKSHYADDRSKIVNCFVFPDSENNIDLYPYGEIMIPRITKNRIICARLSGINAVQRYLHRQPFSESELISFVSQLNPMSSCGI